jgi:hypothetical protein
VKIIDRHSITPVEVEGRPAGAVIAELNARMAEAGIEFGEYEFGDMTRYDDQDDKVCNDYRWIACFPVRGSNEGYYVHVELLAHRKGRTNPDTRRLIGLAKTWTWESACEIANAAGAFLDV